jgi:non-heme chloroperoxidase
LDLGLIPKQLMARNHALLGSEAGPANREHDAICLTALRRRTTAAPRWRDAIRRKESIVNTFTVKDGAEIYFKDWGEGPVVTFSHGWPLNSDAWEGQMLFLVAHGYRVIAHDRRGHGRSSQPSSGNDMDRYADDLQELFEALDLHDVTMIGHSTGGGEVARFIGRHGTGRVSKAVLVSAVPPGMVKNESNPDGLPIELFDGIRKGLAEDRAQYYKEFATPFFGANRTDTKVSQGTLDAFWSQCMMGGLKNEYDCIEAFSETDFIEDLKRFDVPTLIVHGDDDQIVPIGISAHRSAKLVKGAVLSVYQGAPHGLPVTHRDRVNADLLAFLTGKATSKAPAVEQLH